MTRIFPPPKREDPAWRKDGLSTTQFHHFWGRVQVPVQRFEHREGQHCQVAFDPSLDTSGWTPASLKVLMRLAGSMSYEATMEVVDDFRLMSDISRASLERLTQGYAGACQQEVSDVLEMEQTLPLEGSEPSRLMVLEVDGVRVLGQACEGRCEGIEVKTAVIHPATSPSERSMIADDVKAERFTEQVSGLLRQADVRENDQLIGVSDGAPWIEGLFEALNVPQVIDVYHACGYLDTLMQELGWSETERQQTRQCWQRGEVNAANWLAEHVPRHGTQSLWSEEAQTAVNYLYERADRMHYRDYKAKGWPIGSGQVEGMNKSVIGKR